MPLGRILTLSDLQHEEQDYHVVALLDHQVVASLILRPAMAQTVKLRQMAVSAHLQGSGTGRSLVGFAQDWAQNQDFTHIVTEARLYARGFYEKLGFTAEGEPYEHIGITHLKMNKPINNS